MPNNSEVTPFLTACQNDLKEVASLLLADLRVDPNKPANNGVTPFFMACQNGHKEVVSLLLADPRIDPNKPWKEGATPLWVVSQNGHLVIVQHLLASSLEIDTKTRSLFNKTTAAEHARGLGKRTTKPDSETEEVFHRRKMYGPLCADLIDAYEKDPAKIRSQLKTQLGPRGISLPFISSP